MTLPAVSQPFTLRNPVLPGTVGSPRAPTPRGSAHPAPLLLPQSATAPGHLSATWWPSAKLQHRPPPAQGPVPLLRCVASGQGGGVGSFGHDGASHRLLLRAESHPFD